MAVLHNFSSRNRHFSSATIGMIYLLLHSKLTTVCLAFVGNSFTLVLSVQYISFSLQRLIITNFITRLIVRKLGKTLFKLLLGLNQSLLWSLLWWTGHISPLLVQVVACRSRCRC